MAGFFYLFLPPALLIPSSTLLSLPLLPQLQYVTVGKDPYQMELPESMHHKLPEGYELKSQKKVGGMGDLIHIADRASA